MQFNSPLDTMDTPFAATPQAAAVLASVPGLAAVVRDDEQRVVSCNDAYSAASRRPIAELIGTRHSDYETNAFTAERRDLMRAVIDQNTPRDFLQFWDGRAWLCRLIPLDHAAFGFPGTLSVIMQAPMGTALVEAGTIHVLRTANFGELSTLTPAEKRSFFDLAMGRSNNEIAERHERSVRTIECHVRAIHEKLGTSSRSAIVRDASERGIQLFTKEQWLTMIGKGSLGRGPGARNDPVGSSEIEPKDSTQTA